MKDITEVKCQDCKHHTNRPSTCHKGIIEKYIGRKQEICADFKRKP